MSKIEQIVNEFIEYLQQWDDTEPEHHVMFSSLISTDVIQILTFTSNLCGKTAYLLEPTGQSTEKQETFNLTIFITDESKM